MSGTWVLDSQALSLYLRADRTMTARLAAALRHDVRVVTSAVTLVEADPQGAHRARMDWALSRLTVEPVTKETAAQAVGLLRETGSGGGHKYALDAIVAATARAASGPVTVLASDVDDLVPLCGKGITVLKV
ncbi:PIN domain-containing protein [Streptomyces sp. NBC_00963]|uniref:PIN domain-containing protein n=2 Tax=unclassified Streptomyces TaxID=2593676 RepID=UPI0022532BB9|nr:PIN domain-containing protein [Streptomyces sp. NBC_01306]WSX43514.1 PIN domain-containing protein [Streptomyces sp. NBC_00963]